MRLVVKIGFAVAFLTLFSWAASAQNLTYTLSGVTFNDGGTASGSFTYNPTTNTYTNINIVTTTGGIRTGATYRFVCGTDVPSCNGLLPNSTNILNLTTNAANQTGLPGLALNFNAPLSAGNSSVVTFALEANCSNATCTAPAGATRTSNAGALSTFTIPTLSEWGLILMAVLLAGAGVLRLRQQPGNLRAQA